MKWSLALALPLAASCWANAAAAAPVLPEVRVRVDLGPNLLLRKDVFEQRAQLFNDDVRWGGWLRGGIWFTRESQRCRSFSWRLGSWVGYRYEPGPTDTMLVNDGTSQVAASQGVEAWMLANDLSAGFMGEITGARGCCEAAFLRGHVGTGLTLTTLQIRSLDDGHVYSDTSSAWNVVGTGELGWRFANALEIFLGGGRLWHFPKAGLEFEQSDVPITTKQTSVENVSRSGWLFYFGVGVEF